MKNQKLILLLALFAGQLLCMDQLTELGKRKSPDIPVQENMQANAMNQVLGNQDLLEMILCKTGLNSEKIPLVCIKWNRTFKQKIKECCESLESLKIPGIRSSYPSCYKELICLYIKLARQASKPITKFEGDIANPQVLLRMAQDAQSSLIKAWPWMRQVIGVTAATPSEDAASGQIGDWLRNEGNQAAMRRVTWLCLGEHGLTCLPGEVSLFIGLRNLDLNDNKLTEVAVPDTLINLQWLDLSCNTLTEVTISDTLTNLRNLLLSDNGLKGVTIPGTFTNLQVLHLVSNQLKGLTMPGTLNALRDLNLYDNQLEEVVIPDTFTNLQGLSLGGNKLEKVTIPDTLTNLQELYLDQNQLEKVTIPGTLTALALLFLKCNQLKEVTIPDGLTALKKLSMRGNQLKEVTIPDTLTALLYISLNDNKLTPESITIPDVIRQKVYIDGETDQRLMADS